LVLKTSDADLLFEFEVDLLLLVFAFDRVQLRLNMAPNILVLGATGETGILTLRQALEKKYLVTAYVRDKSKITADLLENGNLTVYEGDLDSAVATLKPVLENFNAIISLLGPTGAPTYKGTPITNFYKSLLPELRNLPSGKRPYLLVMGTQSIVNPNDGFSFFTRAHILTIKNLFRGVRAEIIGFGQLFLDDLADENQAEEERLEWTVYRLNLLKDYGLPIQGVRAGYVAVSDWVATIDRAQIAAWLLEEAEKKRWVRKLPALWGIDSSEPQYS
jgi:hypothetical protein